MVKIYSLINPINNDIFYVGATILPLSVRLQQHLSKNSSLPNRGFLKQKSDYIKNISIAGSSPKIELLEEVELEKAANAEKSHYEYYVKAGKTLLQDPLKFQYRAKITTQLNGDKSKFMLSLNESLYQKIFRYKNDNDFPSVLATIRFILNQFFKNQNQ